MMHVQILGQVPPAGFKRELGVLRPTTVTARGVAQALQRTLNAINEPASTGLPNVPVNGEITPFVLGLAQRINALMAEDPTALGIGTGPVPAATLAPFLDDLDALADAVEFVTAELRQRVGLPPEASAPATGVEPIAREAIQRTTLALGFGFGLLAMVGVLIYWADR